MAAIYSNGGNRCNILGFNFTKRDALSSVYKISMVQICQSLYTSQRFINNGLSVISNSAFNFNCTHTCIINSQLPPYTRCVNFTDENNNCRIIED